MSSKVFKSILLIVIVALLASTVVVTGVLYNYFAKEQRSQLKTELQLAADATEELGKDYLAKLNYEQYRITWIQADGEIIFDSHADADKMENHNDREEVKEALQIGTGSSVRYSSTLTEQTMYEAVRLSDGSVLRISESRVTIVALLIGMIQPVTLILFLMIILSAYLANCMAKRVVEPLNKLNLEEPLENDAYEELSPLLRRVQLQQVEIKKQVKVLRHKQEEFEQITSNMKEALVLLDGKGCIVSINPAAKVLFSVEGECIGQNFLVVDRRHNMKIGVEETKRNGSYSFVENIYGHDYDFELSRIESEDGVNGIVILAFDITDRINAERNRKEFTANVSHELKTPLQSIIGSAELLENGIVKEEDIPRFIGHIRKEATRLVDLINDIIRLSQLDEKTEMPREDILLVELAQEIRDNLHDVAKSRGITMDIIGSNVKMFGVRSLMYELVYNLCDNAIKYNKQNGHVEVVIDEDNENVTVQVKDTGIGIALEHQEKIFERFYRVDKSHSKQSGGTGLGLSIVKHAVQYHGGRIMIDSKLDEGTCISVVFSKK